MQLISITFQGGCPVHESACQTRRAIQTKNQSMGKASERTHFASARALSRIWHFTWACISLDGQWKLNVLLVQALQDLDALRMFSPGVLLGL